MKKKSVLSILLCLLMVAALFTGCKNNSANSGATTNITVWCLSPQQKDIAAVQDEVNKYLVKDVNVKVSLQYYDFGDYQDKQKLALQGGNPIDLMFTANWLTYSTFAGQGAFQPLDDLLNKYGKTIKKDIQPEYLKAPIINGKLYAIPTNKDMAALWGVLVNKSLADKYSMNFDNVKQPSDLTPFLKTIKDNEPGITPFAADYGNSTPELLSTYDCGTLAMLGMPKTKTGTKFENMLKYDRMLNMFKLARQWYNAGYFNPDVATTKDVTSYKNNQKALMWIEQLKPGKAEEQTIAEGYPVIQVNAWGKDAVPTMGTSDLINSMYAIPKASTHAEAAMKFLNSCYSDPMVRNTLSWGIQGKQWQFKSGSKTQIQYPSGVTAQNAGYSGIYQWSMPGDQLIDYLWETESPDKWTKMKAFNDSANVSPLLGFNLDTTQYQNQIAACANVDTQYFNAIATGSVEPTTDLLSKYQSALDNAGFEDVLKGCNDQVDKFIASKK